MFWLAMLKTLSPYGLWFIAQAQLKKWCIHKEEKRCLETQVVHVLMNLLQFNVYVNSRHRKGVNLSETSSGPFVSPQAGAGCCLMTLHFLKTRGSDGRKLKDSSQSHHERCFHQAGCLTAQLESWGSRAADHSPVKSTQGISANQSI